MLSVVLVHSYRYIRMDLNKILTILLMIFRKYGVGIYIYIYSTSIVNIVKTEDPFVVQFMKYYFIPP